MVIFKQSYLYNDDDFNHNFAIAKAANKEFKDAEEAFLLVQNDTYKSEYCYLSWLARTCIFLLVAVVVVMVIAVVIVVVCYI